MPKKRQLSRRRSTGSIFQELPLESQAMRYLSRFEHPDAALPMERAVAEVVCRLILSCKPMQRGSDFLRLGAAAAGGLLVWSEYVLDGMFVELRNKHRHDEQGEAEDESFEDDTRSHRQLALMKVSGDLIDDGDMVLSELIDPEELTSLPNDWFNPLIRGYPLRSRLARDTLEWLRKSPAPESLPHQVNAAFLADGLGLDPAGVRLLDLIGLCIAVPALSDALANIEISDFKRGLRVLANLIGCSEAAIESLFHPDGMLHRCGVLENMHDAGQRRHFSSLDELLTCHNPRLRSALTQHFESAQAFFASFLTTAAPSLINLPNVHHLRRFTEMALPALRNASTQGEVGLNIMLYGPPGTGKTEYAKLLAREAGLQLFEVDCEDRDGAGLNSTDRMGSLVLAMQSLKGRRDAMVLLDEAEDIFPDTGNAVLHRLFGGRGATSKRDHSKAWMHRLLEHMAIPVIWTTNSVSDIDPATLRRFSLVLKMGEPPRSVKRRLAEQYLGELNLSAAQLDAIAAMPQLTPGHLETTARTVRLAAPESPEQASAFVDQQLTNARRALGLPTLLRKRDAAIAYDTQFVNLRGSHSADALLPALGRHPRAAMCFYGVPGTGKTEFGHHIAQQLDRELIVKSGSDLLSPWVGQTEQLIAKMFEDAADRADEVVLLLDEADTLLADRTRAGASWEVSHTNEFLAQMESFPGIFICTTNLVERLDAAVLRRFQFRLEFEALRAEQLLTLFKQTFARTANPSEESALRRLAGTAVTADFANVARLLRFTPELIKGDLVALVQEEVRGHQGLTGNPRPMGFIQ
ncbi:MAG: AAA family ATPase [Rhodoferax sp.]|nr:AAA family ATPase [Rhodoferax sp.]